jgi:methionyl-tRNA formyltransferase
MKVVFFGTPEISIPFLEMLVQHKEINVAAVVTRPDKAVGRKQTITKSPVKILAEKYDLDVLQPEKIDDGFSEIIKKYKPDFNVVISYGAILPNLVLQTPEHGSVNVHFSLLPKYRGASPVQTALLNGDKETGISFIEMSEELDKGDIYYIKKLNIEEEDNSESLLDKLSQIGAIVLPSVLRDIYDGVLTPIPQDESNSSYCYKIKKEDALVDPSKNTAQQIINKYRAFKPWPGVFFMFNKKRCKLIKIEKSDKKTNPGELNEIDNELILGTKEGSLKINSIQPEGKKPMTDKDFINGFL